LERGSRFVPAFAVRRNLRAASLGYPYDKTLGVQDAFILVYSITSNASFEALDAWVKRVHHYKGKGALIWLVGTKCDLEEAREVSTQRGQDLACSLGCDFSETSSSTGVNVEHVFVSLASILHERALRKRGKRKWRYSRCSIM
jgi:GTPase SAR1 family protein